LDRGARIVELLKQDVYSPYPVEEQVVSIFIGTQGLVDKVPVEDVRRFESELLDFMRHNKQEVLDTIRESKKFEDDTERAVVSAVEEFSRQFTTTAGHSLAGREAEAEAMDSEDVGQEKIQVRKKAKK
ncbi:MAG: F0F1 ATP synthase subunit alpha, partial [Geodermatophilaceae bacterium]